MKVRAAVFASGGGSNFQALLDHQEAEGAWEIVLLVSNRESAGALGLARAVGMTTEVVKTDGRVAADVARDTLSILAKNSVDLILLAGYLRLVPEAVVARYPQRILNIHPALLPAFGGAGMYGMNVHRAVIDSGKLESGATVHFVDEEYDRGAILAQQRVPVNSGDTPEELARRVLEVEHRRYSEAVDHLCKAILAERKPTLMTLPQEKR